MSGEFNIPIGRLNSPAPRFNPALWTAHTRACRVASQTIETDSDTLVCNWEYVVKRLWDDEELTTEWTLEPGDQPLLANKTGATRLRFAALLTFFRHEGRFPANKHEVPATVMAHLARQVGVPAEAYVAYDWRGRTIKYHRVQIRTALGFRETSVEDADQLVDWLTNEVVPHERALDRVRAAI
jgi:hypothetical protein